MKCGSRKRNKCTHNTNERNYGSERRSSPTSTGSNQSLMNQVLQVNTSLSHYKDSHQYVTQQVRCDTQNSPKSLYHLLGMDVRNGGRTLSLYSITESNLRYD